MNVVEIAAFEHGFASALPETFRLLSQGHLAIHPAVYRIALEGSRGLDGKPRPDSDIDLTLFVDLAQLPGDEPERETLLRSVLETTLANWRGVVEIDLAAVFDTRNCGFRCLDTTYYDETLICPATGGVDCFGLYKIQKGFNGYVVNYGVRVEKMMPCLTIWRRAAGTL